MSLQLPDLPPPLWRSCHLSDGRRPKKRYANRRQAQHDAQRIEEEQCVPMHAYRCPCCGAFHVGRERFWNEDCDA